jgi:hypothetical protein
LRATDSSYEDYHAGSTGVAEASRRVVFSQPQLLAKAIVLAWARPQLLAKPTVWIEVARPQLLAKATFWIELARPQLLAKDLVLVDM